MAHNPLVVANQIIRVANEMNLEVGAIKLQKLIYFAEGLYLTKDKGQLITADIVAWDNGPVCPTVYKAFKNRNTRSWSGADHEFLTAIDTPETIKGTFGLELDIEATLVIDTVVTHYGRTNRFELVEISHVEGSPWFTAWMLGKGTKIDREEMRSYFKENPLPSLPKRT